MTSSTHRVAAGAPARLRWAAPIASAALAAAAALAGLAGGLDASLLLSLGAGALWSRRLLAPGPARVGHTAAEHARAAGIVAAHAGDSLDPFALREDKTFFFAHGGLLAYRTVRETAVVSGDPIGPEGTAPAILASFEEMAHARGWNVVMTAVSARHLEAYRALGLRVICIGEESVVDPLGFSLATPAMKTVRKAVRRVERHGWTVEVAAGHALSGVAIEEIARVERAWRAAHPRLQGFAMTLGRLWGAAEDADAVYVLGRDGDGSLGAFLRFARYRGGLSLDVMRRTGTQPNGVNEALIAAAIAHARARGVTQVSLNFAGFSHLLAPLGPLSARQRLAALLLRMVHGRFQLDRLATFNRKFGPRRHARYLVYRGRLGAPRAALRVLQAEAYVRAPREQRPRDLWRPAAVPVSAAVPGARR